MDKSGGGGSQQLDIKPALRRFDFNAYEELVRMYTKRELSYTADILNAFSGLTAVLERLFHTELFFGLPAEALDLALLWTLDGPLHPRVVDLENEDAQKDVFPTWSWTGWTGSTNYRLAVHSEETYATPEVYSFQIYYGNTFYATKKRQWMTTEAFVPSKIQAFLPDWVKRPVSPPPQESIPRAMPDIQLGGIVLQFWAQVVSSRRFNLGNTPLRYLNSVTHSLSQSQQAVRMLVNLKDENCGILFNTAETGFLHQENDNVHREFVLLSRIKDGDERRMELDTIAGGFRIWDHEAFGKVMTGNSLMNVLLVERCDGTDTVKRVTVAQIHSKAWQQAEPEVKLVRLVQSTDFYKSIDEVCP